MELPNDDDPCAKHAPVNTFGFWRALRRVSMMDIWTRSLLCVSYIWMENLWKLWNVSGLTYEKLILSAGWDFSGKVFDMVSFSRESWWKSSTKYPNDRSKRLKTN